MPVNKHYRSDLQTYKDKLICIDAEDMRIHGDYNSDEARTIQIRLNRCAGEGCADDYTITNYFRSLLIGVYANRIRFDAQKFGAEAIVQESEFMWNAISTQV